MITEEPKIKYVKLRKILLVFFIVVAVAAFAFGAYQLTNKEPGDYTITAEADADCPFYAKDITFVYPMEGTSNEIKNTTKELTAAYSAALLRAYKLTDSENVYEGFVNLATINQALKEAKTFDGEVPEELYTMLADAWEKTKDGGAYNLFGGFVDRFWEESFLLTDPAEFDPLMNSYEAERLAATSAKTGDLSLFSVSFGKSTAYNVKINLSAEIFNCAATYEMNGGLLNFGILREAYILEYVVTELSKKGYCRGRITTTNGIALSLDKEGEVAYYLYAPEGEDLVKTDEFIVSGASVCSELRAYTFQDDFGHGYAFLFDGKQIYRHLAYSGKTGGFSDVLMSSLCIGRGDAIVACVYENYCLQTASNKEAVEERLRAWKEKGNDGAVNYQ